MPSLSTDLGTYAQWAAAFATFSAVLVALFKDEVLRYWRKPKLSASMVLAPPDCHKTQFRYEIQKTVKTYCVADVYYLRLWIKNEGRTRAERVQVFVARLSRRAADGRFKPVESFVPMNLRWSHSQDEVFAEGISPLMGKHCDFGHITNPIFRKDLREDISDVPDDQTILALDLEFRPHIGSHLVRPGVYHVHLQIAAANSPPIKMTLELSITGNWFADEPRMFSEGLGVKVVETNGRGDR